MNSVSTTPEEYSGSASAQIKQVMTTLGLTQASESPLCFRDDDILVVIKPDNGNTHEKLQISIRAFSSERREGNSHHTVYGDSVFEGNVDQKNPTATVTNAVLKSRISKILNILALYAQYRDNPDDLQSISNELAFHADIQVDPVVKHRIVNPNADQDRQERIALARQEILARIELARNSERVGAKELFAGLRSLANGAGRMKKPVDCPDFGQVIHEQDPIKRLQALVSHLIEQHFSHAS